MVKPQQMFEQLLRLLDNEPLAPFVFVMFGCCGEQQELLVKHTSLSALLQEEKFQTDTFTPLRRLEESRRIGDTIEIRRDAARRIAVIDNIILALRSLVMAGEVGDNSGPTSPPYGQIIPDGPGEMEDDPDDYWNHAHTCVCTLLQQHPVFIKINDKISTSTSPPKMLNTWDTKHPTHTIKNVTTN